MNDAIRQLKDSKLRALIRDWTKRLATEDMTDALARSTRARLSALEEEAICRGMLV